MDKLDRHRLRCLPTGPGLPGDAVVVRSLKAFSGFEGVVASSQKDKWEAYLINRRGGSKRQAYARGSQPLVGVAPDHLCRLARGAALLHRRRPVHNFCTPIAVAVAVGRERRSPQGRELCEGTRTGVSWRERQRCVRTRGRGAFTGDQSTRGGS